MENIILKTNGLEKTYSTRTGVQTQVLKGISLEIGRGEFLAIMGPSGVGKSTLLHLIGSLDSPDTGDITFYNDGTSINYKDMSDDKLARFRNKTIGFIFQFHHLMPEFTALENVMMPSLIAGVSYSDAKTKAQELMEIVGVSARAAHKPMELSGGEQQRVAIARALINNPSIVLADEPTGNLDSGNSKAVLELLQMLKEKYNLTLIVATHSPDVAAICKRTIIMGDGRIVEIRE
jgi:lipoprotein-releasing system ATP-binding protein